MEFGHVGVGILVELRETIFAAEFDGLAVVGEDVRLIAEVLAGDDAFGQGIRAGGRGLYVAGMVMAVA
jgi:hypothetical protein